MKPKVFIPLVEKNLTTGLRLCRSEETISGKFVFPSRE
jgi:hypothetical protein